MTGRLRLTLLVLVLAAGIGAFARSASAKPAAHRATESSSVVRYAKRFLGIRYRYGGTSPGTGFDCSGFVRFVYGHFGLRLPHYSVSQFAMGRRVARRGLRPGDLVFFDGLGHVGLYIGSGRFIHAPRAGTRVSISSLGDSWYRRTYVGARRLLAHA